MFVSVYNQLVSGKGPAHSPVNGKAVLQPRVILGLLIVNIIIHFNSPFTHLKVYIERIL